MNSEELKQKKRLVAIESVHTEIDCIVAEESAGN